MNKNSTKNHGADHSAQRTVNASIDRKQSNEPEDRRRAARDAAEKPDLSQLTGIATYDHLTGTFLFDPSDVAFGRMDGCLTHGVGQRLTDGTFQFAPEPRLRARSRLILKLPHGRLSRTLHDEVQLTLRFAMSEPVDIPAHLGAECLTAVEALDGYLAEQSDQADSQADGHFASQPGHPDSQASARRGMMTGGEVLPPVPCGQTVGNDAPAAKAPKRRAIYFGPAAQEDEGSVEEKTSTRTPRQPKDAIYFGPATGDEGFVEEKSSTETAQRPKCTKERAATGEALPCGECPRRGGQALPTDHREPDEADCGYYLKVNNPQGTLILFGKDANGLGDSGNHCTPRKGHCLRSADRSKRSDAQGFVGGSDC